MEIKVTMQYVFAHELIMSFYFCFMRKENIVSIILCVYTVALLISNYYSAC